MPELPEVEVVKQSLDKKIKEKGKKSISQEPKFEEKSNFENFFINQKIFKVDR